MADSTGPDSGDDGPVRVGVLGPLTLVTADGPAEVGGARLRVLLARLALDAGRAVRPETLAEALWDAAPPEAPSHALQSLVSRLRRVLGHPGLVTSGPAGYRLAVEPDAVDAVRFERLARAGRRSSARSRPAEAAATLRAALGLWRGPALADVRAAPFAAAEAERLERARLAALEDRVEADLTLGAGFDLVAELESLAAAHPLRERLHAQLIRALALDGRGAEALAAYQRIRELLAEDFGGDPGPHLQAAHLAVLRGTLPGPHARPGPSGTSGLSETSRLSETFGLSETSGLSGRRSRGARGNLDVPLTSFVGRDQDVHRVAAVLGRARLVTLVGPGGAGKTRLANTVGRRLTPSGGVWFVPLAAIGPDDVPRVVLDLLRTREDGTPPRAAVLDHLVETLADDDVVLVLDNCEHVIEAVAGLCEALLGRCPRLRVLATSREPLRIDGETLHEVLPLDLPEPGATPDLSRSSAAVRLFHDRAAAVRPGFTLEGGALAAAVEICRRLDGLPLAIELAAARLRALPVEAVAARLDDRFRLLTGGSRTALPRHRTLAAAVAWSWDLLDRVLQVTGPADPQARALVATAHAMATTEAAGPEQADAAFDRIRTALAHVAPGAHPIVEMARLALGIAAKGDHVVPDEGTDRWSRSLALLVGGVLAMNTGHLDKARDALARALDGFEEAGERWGLAITLSALGSAMIRSGEPAAAPALAERATRYFRELGMPEHTMENEVAAALHRAESGDVDGGRRRLDALLDQAGRSWSAESHTQVRLGLARLELAAGRPARAREHALAGVAAAPPGRSTTPPLTALLLGVLAQVDLAEGFPDRAARRLDHPAVRLTLTWHTPVAAATAVLAAAIELCRGRPERAGRLLGAATGLGGWTGPGAANAPRLARRAEAALGAAGFAAAHAGGAAMSRAGAEGLVAAVIAALLS
ncbi:AfsR/SARP family transcriptional regulator [Nonomuraea sp. NPDC052265]|uniref:AfsR/SARP family transcriptional regulator n=1 Tax=Nonomuraea sp. NPDC052265 TaxID=3364374 RepID=UPI0037CB0F72